MGQSNGGRWGRRGTGAQTHMQAHAHTCLSHPAGPSYNHDTLLFPGTGTCSGRWGSCRGQNLSLWWKWVVVHKDPRIFQADTSLGPTTQLPNHCWSCTCFLSWRVRSHLSPLTRWTVTGQPTMVPAQGRGSKRHPCHHSTGIVEPTAQRAEQTREGDKATFTGHRQCGQQSITPSDRKGN